MGKTVFQSFSFYFLRITAMVVPINFANSGKFSERILGKILGKAFGFILIVNLLFTNGVTSRQYADLVVGAFLPRTPMFAVISALVLVCAFAVRGGLEVVGRAAQLLIPLYVFSLILIIVLLLPEYNPKNYKGSPYWGEPQIIFRIVPCTTWN
ncbi:GerAB/ArcD/ProY family transporter [Pseudalkalibacillus sp. A8]|uniref:GerAB/ArcD/ProY family transporter n=1 Tax=Pseudalkalibacillus sp. A8 TaxID=3382641 RepID=UPI0038B60B8F